MTNASVIKTGVCICGCEGEEILMPGGRRVESRDGEEGRLIDIVGGGWSVRTKGG